MAARVSVAECTEEGDDVALLLRAQASRSRLKGDIDAIDVATVAHRQIIVDLDAPMCVAWIDVFRVPVVFGVKAQHLLQAMRRRCEKRRAGVRRCAVMVS